MAVPSESLLARASRARVLAP